MLFIVIEFVLFLHSVQMLLASDWCSVMPAYVCHVKQATFLKPVIYLALLRCFLINVSGACVAGCIIVNSAGRVALLVDDATQ